MTVRAEIVVGVGESKGVLVDIAAFVPVGEGSETEVDMRESDVDEAGPVVWLALSVVAGAGNSVDISVGD